MVVAREAENEEIKKEREIRGEIKTAHEARALGNAVPIIGI